MKCRRMDRRHGFGAVDRVFSELVMFPSRLAGGKWKRFVFHGSPVRLVTTLHTNIYLCPRRVDHRSLRRMCEWESPVLYNRPEATMAKIRAQYDEYIGQFTYDDEEMTSLYDTDA